MSRFRFQPTLEAMDERIVPDATPVAPVGPPVAVAAPADNTPQSDMSDQAIADRIAAITAELSRLQSNVDTLVAASAIMLTKIEAALNDLNKTKADFEAESAELNKIRSYAVGDVNCRSLDIRQRNRAAIGELMARKPTKPTESDALVHQLHNS